MAAEEENGVSFGFWQGGNFFEVSSFKEFEWPLEKGVEGVSIGDEVS